VWGTPPVFAYAFAEMPVGGGMGEGNCMPCCAVRRVEDGLGASRMGVLGWLNCVGHPLIRCEQ